MSGAHPVRYYHDDTNVEVDAVIELIDGHWGAFEIKLSYAKVDDVAKSLRRMRRNFSRMRTAGFPNCLSWGCWLASARQRVVGRMA